ncbi:hypothetical protein [Methylophaga sp.]|uniref:hypothetical protein n=1 Tax=Methylophaga sp. TaxID=2024840 RepID=UPI0013FF84E2|nr:hypothetical protein [Methylophaga sp.]MTI64277.1 hypothetical protein [Methylophaga sp.]
MTGKPEGKTMLSNRLAGQRGIGLVEVLVAVVIVAVGLLALASFEGELLKSSGETKARSEAISLAEQKVEEFRNKVELGEHNAITSGNDTINGTNATFARSWTVSEVPPFLTGAPNRKQIEVNVLWGPNTDQQEVATVSEIAWIDPAKSILAASDDSAGTAAVPSPRQNASEDVASENVFNAPNSQVVSGTPGSDKQIAIEVDEVDSEGNVLNTINVTLKQIALDSRYYATDDTSYFFVDQGVIAVFVCESDNNCRYIQNHFGGVPLRAKGKVYSNTGTLGNIGVAWTSSDVNACYVSGITTETINGASVDVMNYECVYAGNCEAVPTTPTDLRDGLGNFDASTGAFPNGNGCSTNVSVADIESRNVGPGGEFGDIGLLGLDSQGGGREKVCFLEDTSDYSNPLNVLTNDPNGSASPEDYYLPVTKRLYVTRRMNDDGITQSSEGINRSYSNHNFLIVERGNIAGSYENCYKTLFTVAGGNPSFDGYNLDEDTSKHISLAMREVIRVLNSPNTVASENKYSAETGPSQTILEDITGDNNDLRLYISEGGTCYIKSTADKYACAVPSGPETSATIHGGSSTKPLATTYDVCNKTIGIDTCEWPTDFP